MNSISDRSFSFAISHQNPGLRLGLGMAVMGSLAVSLTAQSHRSASKTPVTASAKALKPTKDLKDFGITPRSFCYWKRTAGDPRLELNELHLLKVQPDNEAVVWNERLPKESFRNGAGKPLNVYAVQVRAFHAFDEEGGSVSAWLRLGEVPQMSINQGKSWVDGEKDGEAWHFAFDNAMATLVNADDQFTSAKVECLAFEAGTVAKTFIDPTWNWLCVPLYRSSVVAVAYGTNECRGIIKFPGSEFVLPFRGVRYGKGWVAKATEKRPLIVRITEAPSLAETAGMKHVRDAEIPWIYFDDARVLYGKAEFLNLALRGDAAERFGTAIEWNRENGVELPELANAFSKNMDRALWAKTDEDGSFSRMAEEAFIAKGLAVQMIVPITYTGKNFDRDGGETRRIQKVVTDVQARLRSLGGKVKFLSPKP